MVDQPDLTKFQRRLAERRAKEEAEKRAQETLALPADQFDADLIPESEYDRSETDQEMDRIIEGIDIIAAYQRWCGKMQPVVKGGQREGVKISCPIPGHTDKDPSAWINLDKQTWFCGGCQVGGDKYDLAAYRYGASNYKSGANFHQLRQAMAESFGFRIQTTPGGQKLIVPPAPPEPEPAADPEPVREPPTAEVVQLVEHEDEEFDIPSLDWRPIVPPTTFLDEYMKACIVDDVPEEYHFFHGLIALGFALGRDVSLFDSVPVHGNLFVCTLGRSGTGKSKARRHLDNLLATALPYDRSIIPSKGVLRVPAPGSAEALVHAFMEPVEDPSNPKKIAYYAPVKGLIDFNELSALTARTNRQGSAMKPTLMQFYDMEKIVETSSMTTGRKHAAEPFGSALTTSQPKALRSLIDASDDASGFLNRWLFVTGKEKKRVSVGGVTVDIGNAVGPLQDVLGWASTFRAGEFVEWSEEALIRFDDFFHSTLEPIRKKAQNDLLIRIDLTLKKLILLFSSNRMEKIVSEQSVLDALYMFPYLKAAYGVPEAQIGNTLNNEISELIMQQVEKYSTKGGLTAAKLWDNIKHRKYDKKRVLDALTTLVKMGLINEEAVNSGRVGRPTVRYKNVG